MAQTIGQHGVAAFTSPVNGDLLNATVVTGNDNTTRSAYVDHDSDSGIHVQSSLLAARPAAGTAGRKWMTTDTGSVKLWFDTGAAWEEIAYVPSVGGNAATATALQTGRAINGVTFDGTAAITVTAAAGTLSGATLAAGVTASSLTSVGTLGSLTVTNPITGSVTGASGSTTGNAATATALQTARNINGVAFDGTANITLPAATVDASALTGTTLASGVTASSLTSVGTLTALTTSGTTSLATSSGAVSVRSVSYTFPSSQGGASTALTNDGTGILSWATSGALTPTQTDFNVSGTYTKPATGSMALIECWGGGGGGSNSPAAANCQGGGGGGYAFRVSRLADIAATVTVTVGAGGAGLDMFSSGSGTDGGTTSFGTVVTAYGGAGGYGPAANVYSTGGSAQRTGTIFSTATSLSSFNLWSFYADRLDRTFSGGWGGLNTIGVIANSTYGGGGGSSTAGVSQFGGNGGVAGANGQAPAGGGGPGLIQGIGASGNGAAGRVRVTVW